jgi:hypothetical protein
MTDALDLLRWNLLHEGRADEMRKNVGNAFWNYQHTLAEWIPPKPHDQSLAFRNLLSGVKAFPCPKCSNHGLEYLNEHPFDPNTDDFKKYVWEFHNSVNEKLGKPYHDFPETYKSFCIPKAVINKFKSMNDVTTLELLEKDMPVCET